MLMVSNSNGASPPGVKNIVAVASGKGGVGKSTTAINLALGLAATGLRVGMLDADIYGPSQPRVMGVSGARTVCGEKLEPMVGHGIGDVYGLVEEDTPMIWRGPMVMSALQQMLRDVNWGELDVISSICHPAPATPNDHGAASTACRRRNRFNTARYRPA